jgi:hypothetical protein
VVVLVFDEWVEVKALLMVDVAEVAEAPHYGLLYAFLRHHQNREIAVVAAEGQTFIYS